MIASQHTKVLIPIAISGVTTRAAPVHPVAVPANTSAEVHSSTFHAAVVLAFGVVVPVSIDSQVALERL